MKALVVGVAIVLFATPALAQTAAHSEEAPSSASSCGALTAAPAMPDGAVANNDAMTTANAAFLAWIQGQQQVLACRRAEIEAAHARWQALSNEYNAGAQTLNSASGAWQSELAQYNGRAGGRRSASNH